MIEPLARKGSIWFMRMLQNGVTVAQAGKECQMKNVKMMKFPA